MNPIRWDQSGPPRVEVDPNMRTPDGLTPAFACELPRVSVGDPVIVFEPEDGTSALARVARLKGQIVLLAVDWGTLRDDNALPTLVVSSAANTTPMLMEPLAA